MTYRVEFTPDAAFSFPQHAPGGPEAFFARAAELADAPWDAVGVRPPGLDPSLRHTLFGRAGIVEFTLMEASEVIRFTRLVWAG